MIPAATTRRRLLWSGCGLAALSLLNPAVRAAAAAAGPGTGGRRAAGARRYLAAWEGQEPEGALGRGPATSRAGGGAGERPAPGTSGAADRPTPLPYPPLPEGARPFAPGEQLRYAVEWSGIGAGEATLEVVGPAAVEGQSGLLVRFTAESNHFVSLFYRLHDRHEALLDPLFLFTRRYEAWIEQGRRRRHRIVVFEPEEGRLTRVEPPSQEVTMLPLKGPVVEGLGLLYHLRARQLDPEGRLAVPVYRKQEVRLVTLGASRPVAVDTPAGRFEAMEVRALDDDGADAESNGGGFFGGTSLRIWFTTDRRRLPIRLAGSARRGSIDARLASVRIPPVEARR